MVGSGGCVGGCSVIGRCCVAVCVGWLVIAPHEQKRNTAAKIQFSRLILSLQ
jgi:hypothetical protein